ncbi:MAG: MOSC domain-containing protein, partial [Steroidobacteraceae bacterium]
MISLAGLHVYPVKSCRGIALEEALLTETGLEHDREWMVVTPEGRFLTQRELPRLALIGTRLEQRSLWLSAPHAAPLEVPLDRAGPPAEVVVWRD